MMTCEPAASHGGRRIWRRLWCAWSRREVEVEFEARGLPGLRRLVGVASCSAFDLPAAVECRRRCLDATFRRQWEPPLPVYDVRA